MIDLSDVDQAGVEVCFQKLQRLHLRGEAGFGVADLLVGLKQTDETADLAGTTTGKAGTGHARSTRSATTTATAATESGRIADAAEAACSLTTETGQSRATRKATTSRRPACSVFADRDLCVEALSEVLERSNVCEKRPFGKRQSFQSNLPPTGSQ